MSLTVRVKTRYSNASRSLISSIMNFEDRRFIIGPKNFQDLSQVLADFTCFPKVKEKLVDVQGVRGQSGFFNWALRERNIQVRLYLKVVLKS